MNLKSYLRSKVYSRILPLIKEDKCCECGSTENLELHHEYSFSKMLDDTLKELNLNLKEIEEYSDLELKNIKEKFLGKHLFYSYKTLCWECHHNKAHNLNSRRKINEANLHCFINCIDLIMLDYLDRRIILDEMRELPKKFNLRRDNYTPMAVPTFVKILKDSNFKITKKQKIVNKIKGTYYFISKSKLKQRKHKYNKIKGE